MKFQVAMTDLQAALHVVKPAKATDSSDMMGHYLFRKSLTDGRMEVLTHEQYTQAMTSFIADIEGDEESFTIGGKALEIWLGSIAMGSPNTTVVFEYSAEDKQTEVYPSDRPTRRHPFSSLDPQTYPSYEGKLSRAEVTGTVRIGRLLEALVSTKGFISGDEQLGPDTMIAELRDGRLKATTLKTLAVVKMPGLEDVSLRFHVTQHVPPVISYLSALPADADIEILEAEEKKGVSAGMYFLQAGDGTIFCWNKWTRAFPPLAEPTTEDDIWWEVEPKELGTAVAAVLSAGQKEKLLVRISRPDDTGPMFLNAVGDEGKTQWDIDINASGSREGADITRMPESFRMMRASLDSMLKAVKDSPITFGFTYRKAANSGYVRVVENRGAEGDEFLFMLAWWKDTQ